MEVKFEGKIYKMNMYMEVTPNLQLGGVLTLYYPFKNTWAFCDKNIVSEHIKNCFMVEPETKFKYIITENDKLIRKSINELNWELWDDLMYNKFKDTINIIRGKYGI